MTPTLAGSGGFSQVHVLHLASVAASALKVSMLRAQTELSALSMHKSITNKLCSIIELELDGVGHSKPLQS